MTFAMLPDKLVAVADKSACIDLVRLLVVCILGSGILGLATDRSCGVSVTVGPAGGLVGGAMINRMEEETK